MTSAADPVCLALYQAYAALVAIEANDIAALDDPAILAAIVTKATAIHDRAYALRIHALADLGATLARKL